MKLLLRRAAAPFVPFLLAASLVSSAPAQELGTFRDVHVPRVWVVDAGGGGDFTALQPAVDAASRGDVLLVRSDLDPPPGEAVRIRGKGLPILGDGTRPRIGYAGFGPFGAGPCAERLVVRDLPPGETVVLRNLAFAESCGILFGPGTAVLRFEGCGGTVWVEDCEVAMGGVSVADGDEEFSGILAVDRWTARR